MSQPFENSGHSLNLYEVLGVSPQAEDIVIRAAYRALAQRYHPDKADEPKVIAAQRMQSIQEAYAVLSSPEKRRAYDASFQTLKFDPQVFENRSAKHIAQLEAQAWEVLLRIHPDLGSNLTKLEANQQYVAQTYRSLLLELISEKLVARLVKSICTEIKDIEPEKKLNSGKVDLRH